jgi:hypothetical protein
MRIDVVGRLHGADQGIGEDVRVGEAARAFLASAVCFHWGPGLLGASGGLRF